MDNSKSGKGKKDGKGSSHRSGPAVPGRALVPVVRPDAWQRLVNTHLASKMSGQLRAFTAGNVHVRSVDGGFVVHADNVVRMYQFEMNERSNNYFSHMERGYDYWYIRLPDADLRNFIEMFENTNTGTDERSEWSKSAVEFGHIYRENWVTIAQLHEQLKISRAVSTLERTREKEPTPFTRCRDEARNRLLSAMANMDTAMFLPTTLDCRGSRIVFAEPRALAQFIVSMRRGLTDLRLCVATLLHGAGGNGVRQHDQPGLLATASNLSAHVESWAARIYSHNDGVSSSDEITRTEMDYEISELSLKEFEDQNRNRGPGPSGLR